MVLRREHVLRAGIRRVSRHTSLVRHSLVGMDFRRFERALESYLGLSFRIFASYRTTTTTDLELNVSRDPLLLSVLGCHFHTRGEPIAGGCTSYVECGGLGERVMNECKMFLVQGRLGQDNVFDCLSITHCCVCVLLEQALGMNKEY